MWYSNITLNLLYLVLLAIVKAQTELSACEQREKQLVALDLAQDSITKAKALQPACFNDLKNVSSNSSECGAKEKVSAYLDYAHKLIEEAKENFTTCDVAKNHTKIVLLHEKPKDCLEVMENGNTKSGEYTIWLTHSAINFKQLTVYCDMDTDLGGWTVIQRRGNFSKKEDFFRIWKDYKRGFGNISEEFWMGNDNIFALTNQANYTARFDMENVDKEYRFATYSSFRTEDESAAYTLHFGNYSGTAGDGIKEVNNMGFTTKDKIFEKSSSTCLTYKMGGWWYSDCGWSDPNGINLPGPSNGNLFYMNWYPWTVYDSLLTIEIKLRPEKKLK